MHLAVLLLSLDLETAVHVPSCNVTKSARTPVILLLHVLYVQYASLKKASRNMTNHAGGDDLVALDIDRSKTRSFDSCRLLLQHYSYSIIQQTKISVSKTRSLSILDVLDVECAYSILSTLVVVL